MINSLTRLWNVIIFVLIISLALPLAGADDVEKAAQTKGSPAPAGTQEQTSTNTEIARLKAQLELQQKQLDMLRAALEEQKKALESVTPAQNRPQPPSLGEVASTTAVVPVRNAALAMPAIPDPQVKPIGPTAGKPILKSDTPTTASNGGNPCEAPPEGEAVPPYLRIGNTCVQPIGFMDLTSVWRDKDAGSSLGSSFGSVPYNNVAAGKLSEFRFTPQNSRIGFRADGNWKGAHFIAYNEFDFLGTSASNGIGVTNGAFVPRLRLFWIDVRKGSFELLGGQSWSMLTPNRRGISALPGDLFYSQVIDVNYMAGLTWTRQPGVRFLYHAGNTLTMGISFENPDQYAGGQSGGPKITTPTALSGLLGTQLDDTSTTYLSTPNLAPDIIVKVAFDPSSKFHGEIAGIQRTFKTYNIATNQRYTKAGGGLQFGLNFELVKNFRLVTTNYWSDGGGRYLFGQAPDVVIRADGSVSPIHAGGTVNGFEATVKNYLLYAYYGAIYVQRNTAIDTTGKPVGYGFTGSANGQNRAIQELTFGFNQTLWRNPRYGALNFMGQYEYLTRSPWFVAIGAPKAAHDNTVYFNLRYTLPGSMPAFQ
jgi:hypothetical protein